MKIASASVSMESARRYESASKLSIQDSIMTLSGIQAFEKEQNTKVNFKHMIAGTDENGQNSGDLFQWKMGNQNIQNSDKISNASTKENYQSIRKQCMLYLLELLLRRRSGTSKFDKYMNSEESNTSGNLLQNGMETVDMYVDTYRVTEQNMTYYESEDTSFQTTGKVITEDGTEISFQLEMTMSRRFESSVSKYFANLEYIDPLVISIDGNIPSLSNQKFEFDLDEDGVLETISSLNKGSGFLALDLNGDGMINDGSELFGTKSGDGFLDLSKYDEDHNGWIDENDEIFDKLMIWTKDENGKDELYSLKKAGVGAICLQKMETDFSITDLQNQAMGKVRETGFFLYENGQSGVIQHLDLAT